MTFFLPTERPGASCGGEAHLVLDALPQCASRADTCFRRGAIYAQTVETESERLKLMFRIKAQIDRNCSKNTSAT
jgi:HlyD family secretion protein